jgi:hypothetical protein
MLSIETARRLRDAGLEWRPEEGDRFAVPGTVLQDRIFIINEMAAMLEMYRGFPVITFHGTPEWALDYVLQGETVWLPYEGQVRAKLALRLAEREVFVYDLLFADGVFTCRFESEGEGVAFVAEDAEEAYAAALLDLLEREKM